MAVSFTAERAEFVSATDAASYQVVTTPFTPAAGSLLVLVLEGAQTGSPPAINTVADTGMALTWTQRDVQNWTSTQQFRTYIYTATVGGSPASITALTATWTATILGCDAWVGEFAGHDATTPIKNIGAISNASGTNPGASMPVAPDASGLSLFYCMTRRNPPNWTVPTGWTEDMDNGVSTPVTGMWVAHRTTGAVQTLSGVTGASAANFSVIVEIPPAPTAIDLVVANAAHAHTADNATLVQNSTLVVQDSTLGHAGQSFALTQQHVLAADPAAHAHVAENVVLVPVVAAIDLTVQGAAHAHVADGVTITQQHVLVVQDATHAHGVDAPALVQQHVLVVDSAAHAHTAANATITISSALAIADASHASTSDNVAIAQQHVLVIAAAVHAHVADNVTLIQQHVLVVAGAVHAHIADAIGTMVQNTVLALADALHAHVAGAPPLVQNSTLAVDAAAHLHSAQNVAISSGGSLGVADAVHGHVAGSPALAQQHILTVADAAHAHTAAAPILATTVQLVIDPAAHAVGSSVVVLTGPIPLVVASAAHALTSGGVVLVQVHVLTIDNAWHAHAAHTVVLQYGRPWQLDYVRARPGMVDVSPIGTEAPVSEGATIATTPNAGDGIRSLTPATMRREPEGAS